MHSMSIIFANAVVPESDEWTGNGLSNVRGNKRRQVSDKLSKKDAWTMLMGPAMIVEQV